MWPFKKKEKSEDPRFYKIVSGPTFQQLIQSMSSEDNTATVSLSSAFWDGRQWGSIESSCFKIDGLMRYESGVGLLRFNQPRLAYDNIRRSGSPVYFSGFSVWEDGRKTGSYVSALYYPDTGEGIANFGFDG